jgi:hypothetical protein
VKKKVTKREGGQPNNKNAEKWTEEKAITLGKDLLGWMKEDPTHIYLKEFFLMVKDLNIDTSSYLDGKFKSFSDLLKKAKEIQEIRLLTDPDFKRHTMNIFSLKHNHGYRDKMDIDHTTKGKSINESLEDKLSDFYKQNGEKGINDLFAELKQKSG